MTTEEEKVSDIISVGSMGSHTSNIGGNVVNKRYQIELNIRQLCVQDEKYIGEEFKIYWIRGKRKIDTRTSIVKKDQSTGKLFAKFNDKF